MHCILIYQLLKKYRHTSCNKGYCSRFLKYSATNYVKDILCTAYKKPCGNNQKHKTDNGSGKSLVLAVSVVV